MLLLVFRGGGRCKAVFPSFTSSQQHSRFTLSLYGYVTHYQFHTTGVQLDGQSVTLEPGGQFELSGAPLTTLHQTCAEVNSHLYQSKTIGEELGIGFLGVGFDPKWRIEDIPGVNFKGCVRLGGAVVVVFVCLVVPQWRFTLLCVLCMLWNQVELGQVRKQVCAIPQCRVSPSSASLLALLTKRVSSFCAINSTQLCPRTATG